MNYDGHMEATDSYGLYSLVFLVELREETNIKSPELENFPDVELNLIGCLCNS